MSLAFRYKVSTKAIQRANNDLNDNVQLQGLKEIYIPFYGQSFTFERFYDKNEQQKREQKQAYKRLFLQIKNFEKKNHFKLEPEGFEGDFNDI